MGPGPTLTDLCWRIGVTLLCVHVKHFEHWRMEPVVQGLGSSPSPVTHSIYRLIIPPVSCHLTLICTNRHRGDPSHHADHSSVNCDIMTPLSPSASPCDDSAGSVTSISSHSAAHAWKQRRSSNNISPAARLPGAPGARRDLIWRRLWEVRKLTLVLIYCRRTICPFISYLFGFFLFKLQPLL